MTVNEKNSRGFYGCDGCLSWKGMEFNFTFCFSGYFFTFQLQKEIFLYQFLEFFPFFCCFFCYSFFFYDDTFFEGKFKWWNERIKQNDRTLKGCGRKWLIDGSVMNEIFVEAETIFAHVDLEELLNFSKRCSIGCVVRYGSVMKFRKWFVTEKLY